MVKIRENFQGFIQGMKKIAERYAKALFHLAKTADEKEQYYKDLSQLKNWMVGSSNFSVLFKNPLIPQEIAHNTLSEICAKAKASKEFTQFLLHVVTEGRLRVLPQIIEAYSDLYHAENNISKAEIETAHTLTKDLQENFRTLLEKRFKKKLILNFKVNESLLGGFRVQVGSHQIDSSLMTQLANLSRTLKGAS